MGESSTEFKMVALGFGDSFPTGTGRALSFTVGFESLGNAFAAIRYIGQYNGFDPDVVIPVLERVSSPASGFGTSTSGIGISVGREGSPCIYLNRLLFTGPKEEQDDKLEELCRILREEARADEVDEVGSGAGSSYGRTVRAWWD